jgi:isopentenyl phosphate kinase
MKVIKEILDDMFKAYAESMEIKMSEMLTKLSDIEAKNVELKEQVVTLSAQPSVEPVSSQPKQVTLTKQGRILEAIKLANQNK